MSAIRRIKTSFAAGELSPELLGRADLRAYENGAARLANVFILPTGGLRRRPGLRHLAMLPGTARLIAFEFSTEQTYLLVLTDRRLAVWRGDVEVAAIATPWTEAELAQLGWTQSADTLLVAHPEVPPQRITRTSHTEWTIAPWSFAAEPYHRFAPPGVTLAASATTGTVTLTASAPVFVAGHAGTTFRLQGKRVTVNAVTGPTSAAATVLDTLAVAAPSADWDEAAFSPARGWPVSLCFHQDRLVIGGSRDLPNRLWLSRTGDLFNFDLGEGLDDQAIEFALVSDQVNAIRAVFSGRHLQVFTSGAEWMVSGDPLTPANIQLNRQTRVGSPVERTIPPVDVDGATVFVSRSGRSVHEFAYTDVEQAYQAADLAVLARHLVATPVSMAYDQTQRLLHLVMADGRMATLTLFRAEQVTAWTRQETDGAFRAVGEVDGAVFVVVERDGAHRLERFDPGLGVDAGITGTHPTGAATWSGLDHLAGRSVAVVGDGAPRGTQTVEAGMIATDPPARSVQVGLPFTHVIEPLPPELITPYGGRTGPVRLVAVTFRLLETAALSVDLGRGPVAVPFRRLGPLVLDTAPPAFTGDKTVRALGWRRDTTAPLWRIEGAVPLPLTLLSVTTEMRLNT
ncbi:hypothetical protein FK498_11470 [Elioraea sp. Yellowstone]|jgi:hypothetical protein|uniref:hypothetical protein n=1 Tax=Elioraea sp. Yellowstone TaxID=2592070 RepID=UPI00114E8F76|nr:hypothetical protein [Elioraea sp. Yellowstone]TQF77718.1 hypothetical protein FK498_11470 [Elioraea sp. Yellowstone]